MVLIQIYYMFGEYLSHYSPFLYNRVNLCNEIGLLYRYKWLDKAYVGTATKIVVKKVLLDQFLMTPPLYVIFYAGDE